MMRETVVQCYRPLSHDWNVSGSDPSSAGRRCVLGQDTYPCSVLNAQGPTLMRSMSCMCSVQCISWWETSRLSQCPTQYLSRLFMMNFSQCGFKPFYIITDSTQYLRDVMDVHPPNCKQQNNFIFMCNRSF